MTAAERLAKQLRPEIEAASLAVASQNIGAANASLDRALAILRPIVARKPKLPRPTPPGRPREERRAEHAASTGTLRDAAWERCGGKCEVSGVELGTAWELHHLDAGGNRRSHQMLDNCLIVSWEVHRLIHRGDLATLRAVKEACIRIGMREGLRAVEHRLAKLMEARRMAPF